MTFAKTQTKLPSPAGSGSHFDAAAKDWDQRPMSVQLAQVPAGLLPLLGLRPTEHWLDFGTGTGLLATALAPRVAKVTALDASANMLQVLQDKGFANINTLCADVFDGLPDAYDGVVSCMAMHHVQDTRALLEVFFAHLKPGGRVGLVDLEKEDGSFHGDNEAKGVKHFGFDRDALLALVTDVGFEQAHMQTLLSVQRGNGRSYPLFVLTARKGAT